MLTCIKGGRVIDPAHSRDRVGDIWMHDARIVDAPAGDRRADQTYDATGKIVMAGAIDIHSHIAGSNVNTARLLLPESPAPSAAQAPSHIALPAFRIGCLYAAMGFTTVVEPAVAPTYALHAHLELADIPIIDKATLAVLGNDDFLLDLLPRKESASAVRDYVAWTVATSRSLGIKVINAGGAAAFKANARAFHLMTSCRSTACPRATSSRPYSVRCTSSEFRTRCTSIATTSGSPATPRRRSPPSRRRTACRCTSRTCSSTATARRAHADSRRRPPGSPKLSTAPRT